MRHDLIVRGGPIIRRPRRRRGGLLEQVVPACAAALLFCSCRDDIPSADPASLARPEATPPIAGKKADEAEKNPQAANAPRKKEELCRVRSVTIWKLPDQEAFFFEAGMAIDADGAPDAYHPKDIGRDYLANAGQPGNWWALVTNANGTPVIQGPRDPKPGYYVSMTALEDQTKARTDPRRYVNSNEIPYVALPRTLHAGARVGDVAVVVNRKNRKVAHAILADTGPKDRIGEGSIALARALGVNPDPRHGGTGGGVVYLVFPGSGNKRPRPLAEIAAAAENHFRAWGGLSRIEACFPGD